MATQLPQGLSSSVLSQKYVFGMNGNLREDIRLLDDKKVFFTSGHHAVKYNMMDKTQTFISGGEHCSCITAICISSKRQYIAVAEKGEKPIIFLYDPTHLRKRRAVTLPDDFKENQSEYVHMAFPNDSEQRLMAVSSANPNSIICVFQVDKLKLVTSIVVAYNAPCYEALFNNFDTSYISAIGKRIFKYWKLQDNTLKPIHSQFNGPPNLSQEFSCHTWLEPKGLILCTFEGTIYWHEENGDFKFVLDASPLGFSIECIKTYSKGFIIGGDNLTMYVYNIAENAGQMSFERVEHLHIKVSNNELKEQKIKNQAIDSETEEKIVVATYSRQIYQVNMKTEAKIQYGEKTTQFNQVSLPVHCGRINSLDICIRKPLIATASSDKTLKIWNYEEKTLEYNYTFAEEAFSVAFHPSGLHCIVGFADKIKIMNLFLDIKDQRRPELKEITAKGYKEIRYSNGGHLFAVASGNPQTINVYNFYTGENPSYLVFKGHSGKVKCQEWSRDDLYLFSCGTDGMLYQWRISDGQRTDHVTKEGILNSVACSSEKLLFLVSNNKRSLKEINQKEVNQENANKRCDEGPIYGEVSLTKNNKMIFCGVDDEEKKMNGCIKCFRNPLAGTFTESFPAHDSQGIVRMKVTFDDHYLVSCGRDGTVCLFEIKDKEVKGAKLGEGYTTKFSNEILITKSEIDDMQTKKETLYASLNDDQTSNNQISITNLEDNIQSLQKQIKKNNEDFDKEYADEARKKKQTEAKRKEEEKSIKQKCEDDIRELEHHFNKEYSNENARYDQLKQDTKKDQERYDERKRLLEENHKLEVNRLHDEYRGKLENSRNQKDGQNRDQSMTEYDQQREQADIKTEIDKEYTDLVSKYDLDQTSLNNELIKNKNVKQSYTKKADHFETQIEQRDENYKEKTKSKDTLNMNLADLKEKIEGQQDEMLDKNKKITEREKRIYDLKKRTQELEKYKFVLDFKIKELKRDIVPREAEIKKLKKKQLKKIKS